MKYLPTDFCYYGYPGSRGAKFSYPDSNGNAAGNTIEEAILQGFMELAERDAVALWWYNRLQRPRVDIDNFDDRYIQTLKTHYRHSLHRDIWVLDLTNDLNIPSFAAVSRKMQAERDNLILGFGAHFDPALGILRALTELNQVLPYFDTQDQALDVKPGDRESDVIHWMNNATLDNQPHLVPDPSCPPQSVADYPVLWSDDLRDDVMTSVAIAAERGLETLVLDQTRPDVGLSVVKVIVPGLRHFWRRFAPGRLYDVPVQMGWLNAPLKEQDLNPIALFF